MTNAPAEVTAESLQTFAEAWNRHDVDALMSFMTDETRDILCAGIAAFRSGLSQAPERMAPVSKFMDAICSRFATAGLRSRTRTARTVCRLRAQGGDTVRGYLAWLDRRQAALDPRAR